MVSMFGKKKLRELLSKAVHEGWTAPQLAKSVAVGLYIAMCPFPGAHTIMLLGLKWLLRLNLPILFIATSVNNPWTMIPLYSFDYAFGYWLVHQVIGWTPTWSISLHKIFGSGSICVWSFLIGGNVLGLLAAGIGYPLARMIFGRFIKAKRVEDILIVPAHCERDAVVINAVCQKDVVAQKDHE